MFNVHFRASCGSARLSVKKKGGGGGPSALAGTREYEQSDRNR